MEHRVQLPLATANAVLFCRPSRPVECPPLDRPPMRAGERLLHHGFSASPLYSTGTCAARVLICHRCAWDQSSPSRKRQMHAWRRERAIWFKDRCSAPAAFFKQETSDPVPAQTYPGKRRSSPKVRAEEPARPAPRGASASGQFASDFPINPNPTCTLSSGAELSPERPSAMPVRNPPLAYVPAGIPPTNRSATCNQNKRYSYSDFPSHRA